MPENMIGDIWEYTKNAGVLAALVAFYFMFREGKRADRAEGQRDALAEKFDGFLEKFITATNNTADAVKENSRAILFLGGSRNQDKG